MAFLIDAESSQKLAIALLAVKEIKPIINFIGDRISVSHITKGERCPEPNLEEAGQN